LVVILSLGICLAAGLLPRRACGESPGAATARPAWTSSRITGSPEPPLPYTTERVFPSLTFNQCLDLVAEPGSNRLFVVEQSGKIFSFPNRPDAARADLVIDFAKAIPGVEQVYALAFHPRYEQNRHCYVCYIKAANLEDGTHVARFRMNDTNPPTIDLGSEKTLLTWLSGGHNGCCLKFGPDGYLYISTGDGGPANPPDPLKAGQDLSNLLSAILRIDVDVEETANAGSDTKLPYRIPSDNPFVALPGARGEIWAYGLRNPWRMSFDRATGDFWVGDVGWELWELLYRVERGGNYGWAVMEGRQPTNPEWPRGPTPILPPTIDHPHSESSSITDGLTYYGQRLKDLYGMHLYGDYDTGKIWGFRFHEGQVVDHHELADTTHRIVSFGEDHAGECFLLDHTAGTIHRLIPNPLRDQASVFPRTLSESGLFASLAEQRPAPGVVAYSINAEPWMDHAVAERWVAIPQTLTIQTQEAAWAFPKDSVLVKTLSLDGKPGAPSTRRRVETQILHFDGLDWQPYTYQWNEEQTDAVLVGASGAERVFDIPDSNAPGGARRQTWRFSSRAECQRCHNKWSGPPLGFQTHQLNQKQDHGGEYVSQLDVLAQLRVLAQPISPDKRPQLADPQDASADRDARARAYLHVNCAHCHRLHAGSAVLSKMSYDLPLDQTDMVGARPTQGAFGVHGAQVIAPGDPFRSILWYRMAKLGNGRMPHLGSNEIDRSGLDLIYEWIRHMPPQEVTDATSANVTSRLRQEDAARLKQLQQLPEASQPGELLQQMLGSTSGALMLLRAIDDRSLPSPVATASIEHAMKHQDAAVRDLFERFLPPEQRVQRLGNVVQPDQLLALPGDAARGRDVFFATSGVQCKTCHRIGAEGVEVGPELTAIGKKYNRAQLLESILYPSKAVDPKFVTYLAETHDGQVLTGLLVAKNEREIVLRDAQNKLVTLPADQVERLVPQAQSLMPELLLRDMTAQQVADLLEFLSSQK
jgi:uncharacterized repeat protein (TIGR03806 family)